MSYGGGTPIGSGSRVDFEVDESDSTNPEARELLAQLGRELDQLTGSDGAAGFRAEDARSSRAVFLLARRGVTPVGCGALRPIDDETCEVKRVYASLRGVGLGAFILSALESRARGFGYRRIWLETRELNQRAVRFYLKHGYRVRPNYGPYVGRREALCFEKDLSAER